MRLTRQRDTIWKSSEYDEDEGVHYYDTPEEWQRALEDAVGNRRWDRLPSVLDHPDADLARDWKPFREYSDEYKTGHQIIWGKSGPGGHIEILDPYPTNRWLHILTGEGPEGSAPIHQKMYNSLVDAFEGSQNLSGYERASEREGTFGGPSKASLMRDRLGKIYNLNGGE